ncbi:MAG: transglycosylase domain-containing protein [Prochlorotrichaceae cyanobacterium]
MTKSIPKQTSGITESQTTSVGQSQPSTPARRKRSRKDQGSQQGRWGKLGFLFRPRFVLLALFLAGAGSAAFWVEQERQRIISDLPDAKALVNYAHPGSRLFKASDGSILLRQGATIPKDLPLADMPPQLINAFLAAEDRRFYEHSGVDYQSIVRAIVTNLRARRVVEGGSTLTQQLARIVFLSQEHSLDRKVREALLAQKIERNFSKAEILERYLNLVYLGSGAYGITDAAWIYFSKEPKDLTLGEIATLAAMPPAPSIYSPLINLDVAQAERNKVLSRMEEQGHITTAEAAQAKAEPLVLNPSPPRNSKSPYPYFTSYVQKELDRLVEDGFISADALSQGGLEVETTLNPEWQALAEEIVAWVVERDGYYERFEQAAFVIVDPHSGGIPVMIGGMDFSDSEFNRVTQAYRQPGSTFKTFVYTAAIAAGFSPYKGYVDAPITVDGYKPKNYGGTFRGSVSMRDAFTFSINTVALKTLLDVGFEPVLKIAKDMGIESELQDTYSLALGAWEVNLLELTSAYGTLANAGVHVPAHGVSRILNRQGEVIFDAASLKTTQAVDADTAAIMTWMLQNVVDGGTGRPARLSRPVAGKTGTSEKARDLWFVGYIPQLVAGVWLGNDDNSRTWGSSGTAAYLWGEVMRELVADLPVEEFPRLPDLASHQGSIEAVPVKPRRIKEGTASEESDQESFGSSEDSYDGTPEDSGSEGDEFAPSGDAADPASSPDGSDDFSDDPVPLIPSTITPEDGIPWSGDAPVIDPGPIVPVDETLPPPLDEPAPMPEPLPPSTEELPQ